MSRPPLIGVTACRQQLGKYSSHTAGDKYVEAAAFAGMPVILPALEVPSEPAQLLASLDGLLFTGSPSNVEPRHYNGPASVEGTAHDVFRDRTTLPLLRAAIAQGVPVLCICRGFQELNVALGGSLHQRVQELPGYLDHREPQSEVLAVQYAPKHAVQVQPGGLLDSLGLPPGFEVNSLHSQGIDRLASDLRAEALAPTVWSKRCPCPAHQALSWACSGTRNGSSWTTLCRSACSMHFARPARGMRAAAARAMSC